MFSLPKSSQSSSEHFDLSVTMSNILKVILKSINFISYFKFYQIDRNCLKLDKNSKKLNKISIQSFQL
jgi:hypothetical protein